MGRKLAVIVGAGPGMGESLAKEFGSHGYRIVLVSRNQGRLDALRTSVEKAGVECYTQVADASDVSSLDNAFTQIREKYGAVELLVYNAFILSQDTPTSLDNEDLMHHFQVDVASALFCAKKVLPDMLAEKTGGILITGGGFALYPNAQYTCISVNKAALRALAMVLHDELNEKGIYVGTVTIMGEIKPGTHFDPADIAAKYWELYTKKDAVEYLFR